MKLTVRTYRDEDDYWRIREFLRQAFLLNDRRELSWHVARFDYWRWHAVENRLETYRLEDVVFIWEAADGRIAGVLNPEESGHAFLHIHPALRSIELAKTMLDTAEERLSIPASDGRRKLAVWVHERDDMLGNLLARRGYSKTGSSVHINRRQVAAPVPGATAPAGYTVRALGDVEELPARSWASWRGFHPDAPDEDYEGWEWYRNIQRHPLYRRDLDIVAIAPSGEIASFCTVWYDDVTRSAYFEPVATVPEHLRRGLARAVMHEGLRRLQRLGAVLAHVHSYEADTHAVYTSIGFAEHDLLEQWTKVLSRE